MSVKSSAVDVNKFVNAGQIGGIEQYVIDDGAGRGVRVACFNTGGGLRFRVLVDRGLDIDLAFFNQHSIAYLTHMGATAPSRGLSRGEDWLKGFPAGLLTSCGPFNIGAPCKDGAEELGLHGSHSNTPAEVESVVQPSPRAGKNEMSIAGRMRYGKLYGPCVDLKRTIRCELGSNAIDFTDEFFNAGNTAVPHAWLLHINFGYPLLDAGAEYCYDSKRVEPRDDPMSKAFFAAGADYKRITGPLARHAGEGCVVGYLFPKALDRAGRTTVGIVNRRLGLGVAVHYSTREFGRCGNWQHLGRHEYVSALEPMNGTVDGRDKDRARGLMDTLAAGASKTYRYRIEVVSGRAGVEGLRKLNG